MTNRSNRGRHSFNGPNIQGFVLFCFSSPSFSLSLSLSSFLSFFLSLSLSCQEILWTSIDVISIPIDPRSLALISDGRIKTDGQTASGPGGAAGSGSGGIEGFEAASSTPVASHGGLQRGRRLHHRYWILITADRLDASTVSSLLLFFPSPSLSLPPSATFGRRDYR